MSDLFFCGFQRYMCIKDINLWSYPHKCAQIERVINNPHVNNLVTNKVIHISTDLFTMKLFDF